MGLHGIGIEELGAGMIWVVGIGRGARKQIPELLSTSAEGLDGSVKLLTVRTFTAGEELCNIAILLPGVGRREFVAVTLAELNPVARIFEEILAVVP